MNRTVFLEPAGSSGLPVEPPVWMVQPRFDLNPVQMTGSGRNGDRPTVGPVRPADPIRFLKHWVSAFRAIIASQFRRSKPSSLPKSSVQSHHRFSVSAFRVIIILSFGVQSHHRFPDPVFRVIIASQFRRLELSSFSVLTFRAIITSRFWCSEPSSVFNFGFQSRHRFSVSAFRAIIASQFWHSEPSSFSVSAFRATISYQLGRSEPPSFSSLTFRATICLYFLGISFVLR